MMQPKIEVGILVEKKVYFSFSGEFYNQKNSIFEGSFQAQLSNGNICLKKDKKEIVIEEEMIFHPKNKASIFELKKVTIGIDFHWEQKEDQQFQGALKLIKEDKDIRVINIVGVEDYLKSVISSEMSATSSPELLRAHSVISRSWLLAQIEKSKSLEKSGASYVTSTESETEIIRWYDREDHKTYDVCADDHCQRYQGITKIRAQKALKAVEDTFGEVLFNDDKICDARFSKSCGGITESFENVWEPKVHSYLTRTVDNNEQPLGFYTNFGIEENAENWIRNTPPAFCNTFNKTILSQVLPDFDQATTDFYRWKVEYTQKEIAAIIYKRSGFDFGEIVKLEPIKRGVSGRLIKLKITGTKKSLTIGKELEIRKWLSDSHLYSSAFVIDHLKIENGIPQKFVLSGAGWGHGVGLCQIGAAVMGENGYSYKEILNHYFKGIELKNLY